MITKKEAIKRLKGFELQIGTSNILKEPLQMAIKALEEQGSTSEGKINDILNDILNMDDLVVLKECAKLFKSEHYHVESEVYFNFQKELHYAWEVEEQIREKGLLGSYFFDLWDISGSAFDAVHATPYQRLKTALITIKEQKKKISTEILRGGFKINDF